MIDLLLEYDHVSGGAKDPSGATGQGFHPDWGNYGEDGNGECGVPTMMRYQDCNSVSILYSLYLYNSKK